MTNYLLDSNVVIDLLRGNENVLAHYRSELNCGNKIFICPIVYYEIVRGFKILDGAKKLKTFLEFYKRWDNIPLSDDAMEKAAEIYVNLRRGFQIEDNDIFIAAVAIVNGCTLITANDKYFSRVEGLKFDNWR